MPKKIACLLAACFLTGCSTYADQNISGIKATGSVLDKHVSNFCQHASYATKDGVYRGGAVLSHLMGFWQYGQQVSQVRFTSLSEDEFSTEYLDKQLNVLGARRFSRGEDYQVENDGSLEIKVSSRCGSGGGPGLGCTSSKIRIFTDQTGNLAVIQATGGAGIAGIVPVASSASYLSLFPPITRTDDSSPGALANCPASKSANVPKS